MLIRRKSLSLNHLRQTRPAAFALSLYRVRLYVKLCLHEKNPTITARGRHHPSGEIPQAIRQTPIMLNMKCIISQRGNNAAHRLKIAYHSGSVHCFSFRVDPIIHIGLYWSTPLILQFRKVQYSPQSSHTSSPTTSQCSQHRGQIP